ncbi:MAG: class B sortase [Ruminiclostridium sp.]|nr:class B sortase [Ruminiclostridium sp.]
MANFKKARRFAAAAAALAMILSMSACGEKTDAPDTSEDSSVTTTAPEESDAAATTTTTAPKVTTTTTTTLPPLPVMSTYEAKYAENEDLIGWIKLEAANLNDPVMQAEDNKYYLDKDFNGNEYKNGSFFVDYKCQFTTRTRPANTIIYGHNMVTGPSFAKLTRYYDARLNGDYPNRLDFYMNNPTIQFDTVWEEGTYKVFACMYVNTMEEHGEVFKYYKQRDIKNEGQFYEYIAKIMDRSVFYTDVDLEYGDEILTLSTCYYPLGKEVDSRCVVFARRVRDGESAEVDTSKAYINESPLYFDYYYKVNGGKWAGRTWDTTKVKGFDEYLADFPNSGAAAPVM